MNKKDLSIYSLCHCAKQMGIRFIAVMNIIDCFEENKLDIARVCNTDISQLNLPEMCIELINYLKSKEKELNKSAEALLNRRIDIISCESEFFPVHLRKKLGNHTPPILYSIGNKNLATRPAISIVGPRNMYEMDSLFAAAASKKCVEESLVVVSGGASGVDNTAHKAALMYGGETIAYLPVPFDKSPFVNTYRKYIEDGSLLCLYAIHSENDFRSSALIRNKYIHSHGEISVVVRSQHKKGGSWSGAYDNLIHGRTPTFVSDIPSPGNEALIKLGARRLSYSELRSDEFSFNV